MLPGLLGRVARGFGAGPVSAQPIRPIADPDAVVLSEIERECQIIAAINLADARNQYERNQWLGMRDMARVVLGILYMGDGS